MSRPRGFTLIELMIAVAIVAILAAIALPSYTDYVTRGRIGEAISGLSEARARMEQFFLDNRSYAGAPVCTTPTALPTARSFNFDCPTFTPTTYTIRAMGLAAQGMGGFTYTIDQNNVRASSIDRPGSGWTGDPNCWVTKKGGIC